MGSMAPAVEPCYPWGHGLGGSPTMASQAPCSTVSPGTGAALEAICHVSLSLVASMAPTPLLIGCCMPSGRGGVIVRLLSQCPVFLRVPSVSMALFCVSCSCLLSVNLVLAVFDLISSVSCFPLVSSVYL